MDIAMLERELKTKIANTISRYKLKCDQLEDEINVLKSAIYQLSLLPNSIHVGLDKQMHNLQANLKENKDGKKIKKSVESLVNAMSNLKEKEKNAPNETATELLLTNQINSRFNQLLEHLFIPEDLSNKFQTVKENLNQKLTAELLTNVVDAITDLVIESFNLEHNQFKGFLNRFVDYLHDFTKYLELTDLNNVETHQESEQFETELENNIKQIHHHISEAKTIEELAIKVENSLDEIGQQIRLHREKEQQRIKEYDEKIVMLQGKLEEAECGAEKIRNQLSFHKVRINQDSLTGLPNRTAYDEYILAAFHRWQRGFGELSLGIADIDHFKAINDKYGHLAGDRVLKKVASIFKSSIRAVDFIARYGGEEFIFLFERTSAHDGGKVLENLRIAVEECEFYYRDTRVQITASFGLTAFQHEDSLETFFARADEAMYQAKKNGRNQVIVL
jgi:diguanylate cyclase